MIMHNGSTTKRTFKVDDEEILGASKIMLILAELMTMPVIVTRTFSLKKK